MNRLWTFVISLLNLGVITACGSFECKLDHLHDEPTGCWIQIQANTIPTPSQATNVLEKLQNDPPDGCHPPKKIHLDFYNPEIDKTYLSVQTFASDGPYFLFDGRNVPRQRWGQAEAWGESHCKTSKVQCLARVTADGDIQLSPILAPPTFRPF